MPKIPNLRTKEYTTSSGKDVKDTSMLSGESRRVADENAKNDLSQYTTSGNPKGGGNLGGKASHT